jgi:ribonucleoside-diphosphate reductase alpha chain
MLVTDAFISAIERDRDWPVVFAGHPAPSAPRPCGTASRATYDRAELGVIFVDRINLAYCETVTSNPR